MHEANPHAFKEWAVVCEALAAGGQSLVLRKGGLHEGRDGFRVQQDEFWLFPTRYHQQPDELTTNAQPLMERALSRRPSAGTIRLDTYAVVEQVIRIEDETGLPRLTGLHILSERTLAERFAYRTPGLFALLVRVYWQAEGWAIADSPHLAGCRSWVELPQALPTAGLQPVLSDADHRRRMETIRDQIEPRRWT